MVGVSISDSYAAGLVQSGAMEVVACGIRLLWFQGQVTIRCLLANSEGEGEGKDEPITKQPKLVRVFIELRHAFLEKNMIHSRTRRRQDGRSWTQCCLYHAAFITRRQVGCNGAKNLGADDAKMSDRD